MGMLGETTNSVRVAGGGGLERRKNGHLRILFELGLGKQFFRLIKNE